MTIKPDLSRPLPTTLGAVHFVGIGGAGMSGIARLFLEAGHQVSGSDRTENDSVRALRELGARISIGHDAAHVGAADALVVTSALWPDNPELLFAQQRGLPVLHRSQALAWLIGNRRLIAVAGAHGKTTSTGMIVTALLALSAEPSFVSGGVLSATGVSAGSGNGELFVVEADESDGSFLLYRTAVAMVTNVDPDHIDHYGSLQGFEDAFVSFASAATEFAVISADDPGALRVAARMPHNVPVFTFGTAEDATVSLRAVQLGDSTSFRLRYRGKDYPGRIAVPGMHNALNAAGAFAVLVGLGFPPAAVLAGIEGFGGTQRRFQLHGTVGGVSVFDDYAHHPTEVAAALSAARTVVGNGRIIAVHQPHLYSRTRLFAAEFAETLEEFADATVVLDVYGAREDPEPGVTGALVVDRFRDPAKVSYQPDWGAAAHYTASIARDGDFVITLGCGNVNLLVPQLLAALSDARTSTG